MTLCVIDEGHCMCQPDEGIFCPNYKPDAYVQCLMDTITELLEMRVVCGECGYTVVASQATPQPERE